MNFDCYYYVRIPQPISICGRFSRLEATVFGVIFAAQKIRKGRPVKISIREIARRVGCDDNRSKIRKALEKLESESVLEKLNDGSWRTVVPEWIESRFGDLIRDRTGENKGHWNMRGSVEPRGVNQTPRGGLSDFEGGSIRPKNGSRGPHKISSTNRETNPYSSPSEIEAREEDPDDTTPSRESIEMRESGRIIEFEDVDRNSESVAASEALEDERVEKIETHTRCVRRAKTKQLVEDERTLREPSKRVAFGRWRGKSATGSDWNSRDVVGYFVCRHVETRGAESSEFFATTPAIFNRVASNVSKYVTRWFDGDYNRAKAAVDKIFARAEGLGLPVKLSYFFTPANGSTIGRLDESPRKRTRELAPHERNDARGDYDKNKEYWDQRQRKSRERAAAKKASK